MQRMGLMKKIFGHGASGAAAESLQFHHSEPNVDPAKSRSAPRRELVQVVLRDTIRKHGIPSDWIDCRVLSVQTRQGQAGMHVQFLVRKGDEQLLHYVHAFQESFWEEILKFEPQAQEWLFSLAWQFYGKAVRKLTPTPGPSPWADEPGAAANSTAGDTEAPEGDAEDLESDLQALYAIRDAAFSPPDAAAQLPPAQPARRRGPGEKT